jgi:hypothetical protein
MVAISRILQHNSIGEIPGRSYPLGVQSRLLSECIPNSKRSGLALIRASTLTRGFRERRQYAGAHNETISPGDRQETSSKTLSGYGLAQRVSCCLRGPGIFFRISLKRRHCLAMVYFIRKLLEQMRYWFMSSWPELPVYRMRYGSLSGHRRPTMCHAWT